jgi:hypothetical protein
MGFFSQLRGKPTVAVASIDNIARAVLSPAVVTMAGAGEVSKADQDQLVSTCMFSPIFQKLGYLRTGELIGAAIDDLSGRGPEACLRDAVDTLSPSLRETAMCFAIRAAHVDGAVDDSARAALSEMSNCLQIEPDRYSCMFEAITILQRSERA